MSWTLIVLSPLDPNLSISLMAWQTCGTRKMTNSRSQKESFRVRFTLGIFALVSLLSHKSSLPFGKEFFPKPSANLLTWQIVPDFRSPCISFETMSILSGVVLMTLSLTLCARLSRRSALSRTLTAVTFSTRLKKLYNRNGKITILTKFSALPTPKLTLTWLLTTPRNLHWRQFLITLPMSNSRWCKDSGYKVVACSGTVMETWPKINQRLSFKLHARNSRWKQLVRTSSLMFVSSISIVQPRISIDLIWQLRMLAMKTLAWSATTNGDVMMVSNMVAN